jgi:hypothetical protein
MSGSRTVLRLVVYTALRLAIFLALFAILWLVGINGLLAAAIAVLLSVPLSFVLLARPRAALADDVHQRIEARQRRTAALDEQLAAAGRDSRRQSGSLDGDYPGTGRAAEAEGSDIDVTATGPGPGQDAPAQPQRRAAGARSAQRPRKSGR